MSDIVERLLNDAESHYEVARSADMRPEDTLNWGHGQNCQEAANTIARLTSENEKLGRDYQSARDAHDKVLAENEKLRAALARIENEGDGTHAVALARAALSGDKQ